MKQKLDFVTNSSSTSFCAWGIEVSDYFDSIPKPLQEMVYNKYVEWAKKYHNKYISYEEFIEDPDVYEWIDYLNNIVGELGLSQKWCYDGNFIYIGISPNKIPENKTIKEAKDETKQKLEELGLNTSKFGFILESWYD